MVQTLPVSKLEQSAPFPIVYPSGDDTPMAETDTHVDQIVILKTSLELYYQHHPDVSINANIFLYYEEGDPGKQVSPDVMVTLGVPKHKRSSFFIWKEGKAPDVVFEITSESSLQRDTIQKLRLYQRLKVQEYFIFNPLTEPLTLSEAFMGYRLAGNHQYHLIEHDGEKVLSEVLQLELVVQNKYLRLRYPGTQEWIPTLEEAWTKKELVEQKLQEETKARELLQQKLQELEDRLKELATKKERNRRKGREK